MCVYTCVHFWLRLCFLWWCEGEGKKEIYRICWTRLQLFQSATHCCQNVAGWGKYQSLHLKRFISQAMYVFYLLQKGESSSFSYWKSLNLEIFFIVKSMMLKLCLRWCVNKSRSTPRTVLLHVLLSDCFQSAHLVVCSLWQLRPPLCLWPVICKLKQISTRSYYLSTQ